MRDQERIAKHGINVLSFFDGISAGQEALRQLGVKVANYYAIEIEESAIKVTEHNFPNTIQKGNILAWENKEREFLSNLPEIDLVFAGSPCQGFSKAGNREGLDHELSRLFFNFHKILQVINSNRKRNRKPPVPFFFENVIMDERADLDEDCDRNRITKYLGVGEPFRINAKDYSVCARDRYYWTNLNIPQTIFSKYKNNQVYQDIMDTPHPELNRLVCYSPDQNRKSFEQQMKLNKHRFIWYEQIKPTIGYYKTRAQAWTFGRINGKLPCFSTASTGMNKGLGAIAYPKSFLGQRYHDYLQYTNPKSKRPPIVVKPSKKVKNKLDLNFDEALIFLVSVPEALFAMGFPKDYMKDVDISRAKAVKGIGNSWSVTVVKLLIEHYCTRMGWIGTRKS